MLVAGTGNNRIKFFNEVGEYRADSDAGKRASARFLSGLILKTPWGVQCGSEGNAFVTNEHADHVLADHDGGCAGSDRLWLETRQEKRGGSLYIGPMARIGKRFGRLSYANVVATLALFVSLGGASYAAVALPTNSVGPRQLRSGAVTPRALGFPLGVSSYTEPARLVLPQTPLCRAMYAQCVAKLTEGTPLGRTTLSAPGQLLLSAVATVQDEQPTGSVQVQLAVLANGHSAISTSLEIKAGEQRQVPLQVVVSGRRGTNTIGFAASAHYGSEASGNLSVYPVTVVAMSLPNRSR